MSAGCTSNATDALRNSNNDTQIRGGDPVQIMRKPERKRRWLWTGWAAPVLLMLILLMRPASAQDWPGWRGPQGTGISREAELPVVWNRFIGVRWRPIRLRREPVKVAGDQAALRARHGITVEAVLEAVKERDEP